MKTITIETYCETRTLDIDTTRTPKQAGEYLWYQFRGYPRNARVQACQKASMEAGIEVELPAYS